MARSPRIFFPGAIYHVYCRTARGEMVFSDRLEAHEFVETVIDVKRLHGFLVLGWCLMSTTTTSLSRPGRHLSGAVWRGSSVGLLARSTTGLM